MTTLQTLRKAHTTIRWMLLWFCLSVGVAVAAPVVHPQSLSLVCTAAGSVKLVPTGDAGSPEAPGSAHLLDCVLCLPGGAAPSEPVAVQPRQDLRHVYRAASIAPLQWRVAIIRSARDPPLFA
jgi:hypothetical protein